MPQDEVVNEFDTSGEQSELDALNAELEQLRTNVEANFSEYFAQNATPELDELFFEDKKAFADEFQKMQNTFFDEQIGQKQARANELEIPCENGYYQSVDNERFFIYDGQGELDFENECTKQYDFSKLNVRFLDYFLGTQKHHPNADENEKKVIENFISLMELNEKFGNKITPPYYTAALTLILAKI